MAVAGAATRVLEGLRALGEDVAPVRSTNGNWIVPFDSEALKRAADEAVSVAGAETRLHALMTGVCADGTLRAVRVTDHSGTAEIAARAFVDASGEATLAALAGVRRTVPGPGPDDHVQPGSAPMRVVTSSGAVPDQAALERVAARANAALPDAPVRPDGGIFMPMSGAGEAWWMCIDLPTDGLTSASLTAAETAARRAAWAVIAALRAEVGMGVPAYSPPGRSSACGRRGAPRRAWR